MLNTSTTLFTNSIKDESTFIKLKSMENLLNSITINQTEISQLCEDVTLCWYEYLLTNNSENARSAKAFYMSLYEQSNLMSKLNLRFCTDSS